MVEALLTIILLPVALGVLATTAFWVAVAVKANNINKRRDKENLI